MASRKHKNPNKTIPIEDYEHSDAKRTNNPPAGLAHLDREETPIRQLNYDPHLDPQLIWAGKAERSSVSVPAPSIHVHEELSAQKIVGAVRQQRLQQPLFDVNALEPDQAVEFYKHNLNWSNRMILGDSLTVMSSLLEREGMHGQAQCIFVDPPYGIKYQSNFQPGISSRHVTDGKDDDLTREPEMIQAYRDTWELSVHSYLTYLRDRFTVAHELLSESGSIFVQINDENVHRVRAVLDEVFGAQNFVVTITVKKKSSTTPTDPVNDFLLWYAKRREAMHVSPLYEKRPRPAEAQSKYTSLIGPKGEHVRKSQLTDAEIDEKIRDGYRWARVDYPLVSQDPSARSRPFVFDGKEYACPTNRHWTFDPDTQMQNLMKSGRIFENSRGGIAGVSFWDDFPYVQLDNIWDDFHGEASPVYVVQTNHKILERCINLTTQPGDLVIDPTCGSGTTAFACEKLGRRWITVDTSRVALAIARERLLTATYPYYELLDPQQDVDAGFVYEIASRVTLGSIASESPPEAVVLVDRPKVDRTKTRVSGPFTFEALSRYAVDPVSEPILVVAEDSSAHVGVLLEALQSQGVPRPGHQPAKILSLTTLASVGPLQAEGVLAVDGTPSRFAVSLGPRFGTITMAQVGDALRSAIGYDLVVFAGFAVSADAQEKLGSGKVGGTDVALLLANPDLLVGDLLKNTRTSQTFRLYAAPDIRIERDGEHCRVTVEGVDSFDAATGEVTSFGRTGIAAWFLDDDYDGTVFRVSQAFFPVTQAWKKLSHALRGTLDADLVEELHSWTSLPFRAGQAGEIAVRVVSNDGNASEVVRELPQDAQ